MVSTKNVQIFRSKETSQIVAVTGSKQIDGDNSKNIRRPASRKLRNKRANTWKKNL
jgi:hypothetical protein